MTSQCLGRKTNECLKFGDGHYFYTEKRCTKKTETILCKICEKSCLEKDHKNNGSMTEPLPPLSHIYGSPWYDLKRSVYGDPSSVDMAKAKKAQDEARAAVVAAITGQTHVQTVEKKKRTFKVAQVQVQVQVPVTATATVAVPAVVSEIVAVPVPVITVPVVKAKRQPKKVIVQTQPTIQPLATESVEPPLQDLHCITISVRKIEHNGRKYYLNSDKDKLYTVMPDGGVGKYCGRLDKENDRIADFPDSDSER